MELLSILRRTVIARGVRGALKQSSASRRGAEAQRGSPLPSRFHFSAARRLCGPLFVLALWGCASPPEPVPPPPYGSIRVAAQSGSSIDSITVRLDDLLQGSFANPCTLKYVVAGMHKLSVQDSAGARADTIVAVRQDALSLAIITLTRIGPFLGNEAPNFTATDIDGRNFELAAHRGKVVFLSFFEYT